VQLEGQLLPGLSLVRPLLSGEMSGELSEAPASRANHATADVLAANVAGLPIITFPGNLGDADMLLKVWRLMEITKGPSMSIA